MSVSIPFCKTWTALLETEYVAQVLNGESATDGQFAELCSQLLEERLGVGRVLLAQLESLDEHHPPAGDLGSRHRRGPRGH